MMYISVFQLLMKIDRSKSIMNKWKIETTGNRLNILLGEEVLLNIFIQSENYVENKYL